jgi:hypothetical protein
MKNKLIGTMAEAAAAKQEAEFELQVYNEIITFLTQFISRDGQPTQNLIQIDNSRVSVPESIIDRVIQNLEQNEIKQLVTSIEHLNNVKIKD